MSISSARFTARLAAWALKLRARLRRLEFDGRLRLLEQAPRLVFLFFFESFPHRVALFRTLLTHADEFGLQVGYLRSLLGKLFFRLLAGRLGFFERLADPFPPVFQEVLDGVESDLVENTHDDECVDELEKFLGEAERLGVRAGIRGQNPFCGK